MISKPNEINGGRRGDEIAVYCDGYDIYEISHDVANGFGWSPDYKWSNSFKDLRCNQEENDDLKDSFPKLSDEAYRALLDATIRGVRVTIISGDEKSKDKRYDKICEYNFLYSRFIRLPKSKQKKIEQLLDIEGYKWIQ